MTREKDMFTRWASDYEKETDKQKKDLLNKQMIGFIIGLELSGNNMNVQRCKEIHKKLRG